VYGRTKLSESFLEKESLVPAHHSVLHKNKEIEELTSNIERATIAARESLKEIRENKHNQVNKNRIEKHFKEGDIVFVLDRYSVQGNTRPLRTKFYPSPFVVIQPHKSTALIKRLADGYKTLLSLEDIKKYKGPSPLFYNIPQEVKKVLLNKFEEMIDSDFTIITTHDPLPIMNIDDETLFNEENVSLFTKKGEGSASTPRKDKDQNIDNDGQDVKLSESDSDDDTKVLRTRKVKFSREA